MLSNRIIRTVPFLLLSIFLYSLFTTSVDAGSRRRAVLKQYTFGNKQKIRVGFDGKKIIVQLQPRKGDGVFRFASWTMRDWKNNFNKIKRYNGYRPLQRGKFVTFPFSSLNDNIRGIALKSLFSNDSSEPEGWTHRVKYRGETVSLIAGVFAKKGITPQQLIKYNRLKNQGRSLKKGDEVVIPWKWIDEGLNLRPLAVKKPLYIKKDKYGKNHAWYRIRKGESLYSAVIVRFTGRILADDVNRMARELMKLNGIKNERFIWVNQELKLPLEWISEEYLVQQEAGVEIEEPEKPGKPKKEVPPKQVKTKDKKKSAQLHVILDAGHGGIDPGAVYGKSRRGYQIFEDETVYDISLRMRDLLEKKKVVVHRTLHDPNQKKPIKRLATRKDQDEMLMVNPKYRVNNVNIGINMRIYLINHIYKTLLKQGIHKDNILLMSLHADALHRSLRGVTVYYPDERLRFADFRLWRKVYTKRKEYNRKIRFRDADNRIAQKISSQFGKTIVKTFKQNKMHVHRSNAVRGYHYRRGVRTLPGILRFSKIPTSVLVEVGNINNPSDRKSFLKANYRQKIAATLVKAIQVHFSHK